MFESADPQSVTTVFGAFVFILGGLVGSFLNVCVYRMPKGLSVVSPRSRCPKCENPVLWYDNIPVVSWLLLGAKCRHCGEPISWQYPLVEGITATLFLFVFLKFGPVIATPIYLVLVASLVLVTFVDLTDWTIPNEVTFPGIPAGVLCSLLAMLVADTGLLLDDPLMSIAGLFLGGGSLYALDMLSLLLLRKRGMGFGDVKLMAMLGAFFGVWGVVLIIVLASFFGSVIGVALILAGKRETQEMEEGGGQGHYLPFGPCIVLGALVYLFYGPEIVQRYLDYINVPGAI